MGQESATRRGFLLASSAQVILAVNSSVAVGQISLGELGGAALSLDELIIRLKFSRADHLYETFQALWEEKLEIALASVETEAETLISDLAVTAQFSLIKEYSNDEDIPHDNLRLILAGTVFVQNIFIGVGTDLKTGIVKLTAEQSRSAKQYYCSHYPYCK